MNFLTEAIGKLSETPMRADELVRGLTEEQLSWKPAPGIFSLRENVLHLCDIDVEGYSRRIPLVLDQETPALPDVDGGKLARERNYNAQPIEPALARLRLARAASVARLKQCSVQDLERKAEMQGVGVITLQHLLELWVEHDTGHIRDMVEVRKAIEKGSEPLFEQHQVA